jgi:hypothetical protein
LSGKPHVAGGNSNDYNYRNDAINSNDLSGKRMLIDGDAQLTTRSINNTSLRQSQRPTDETGDIKTGDTVSFTVSLYDTVCPTYAVGVSGYFK